MIKQRLKNSKGITLTSLAIAIMVILILTGIIIYNISGSLKTRNLKELQSDIENLRDKVSIYYMENGSIPAKSEYKNTSHINTISTAVDTGKFLVLDLSAIDNLTLNYGEDYEKIKQLENFKSGNELSNEEMQNNKDLYIINEVSHNIFYVAGIELDGYVYYTDYIGGEVDKEPVDLRYIDGVKIPDGYSYVSGTKETGIIIKSNTDGQEYRWIVQDDEMTEVSNDVNLDDKVKGDFIESVNHYKGYYKSTSSNNKVIYLSNDNWGLQYDEDGIYKDKNGDTVSIPKGFQVSTTPGENTVNEGLVVRDANKNEWVWVEVPKSIYENTQYNGGTAPSGETDYNNIEKILKAYADPYSTGKETKNSVTSSDCIWKDEWYASNTDGTIVSASTENLTDEQKKLDNGCGLTYDEYKDTYQKMLKSVYENEGFWIGRYEAGIEGTTGIDEKSLSLGRTSKDNLINSTKAICQKNAIPYNYVTTKQAQILSSAMSPDESKTSSLLFGIQWDLVCKFLEVNSDLKKEDITSNSGKWGNYKEINFNYLSINAKGQKVTSDSDNNKIWTIITTKLSYSESGNKYTLLSTGASNKTNKLNIYDLAGNAYEWTLEHACANDDKPCMSRGYNFYWDSSNSPAAGRGNGLITHSTHHRIFSTNFILIIYRL